MSPATALGLVVVALVLAVSGQGIPAAILGVAGAALLWRLRDGQPAKSGSDPRKKEAGGDVAEAKTRLEMAIRDRDNILLAAGIPAESIPADKDYLATCLGTLAKLRRSRSDWDRCRTDVTTCEATLIAYFPEGTQASGTKTLLDAAVGSVEAHETAREAVADAQREREDRTGATLAPQKAVNDRREHQEQPEHADRRTQRSQRFGLGRQAQRDLLHHRVHPQCHHASTVRDPPRGSDGCRDVP